MHKKLIFFIVLFGWLSQVSGQNRYSINEVTNIRDSIVYLKSNLTPVSGVVYDNTKVYGGKKKREFTFKEGKQIEIKEWYGDANGHLKYQAIKPEGLWRRWYQNGQLNIESHKNGQYKRWYQNGQLAEESVFHLLGSRGAQRLNYVGQRKDWYDNGQLKSDLNYADGKLDGLQKNWNAEGNDSCQVIYKMGTIWSGTNKSWWDNGTLLETEYKDGEKHKISNYYQGRLLKEIKYKQGKALSQKTYKENGSLAYEWNYEYNPEDGLRREWHKNGNIAYEGVTEEDGVMRRWYYDGQIAKEEYQVDGKLHGLCKYWPEEGNENSEITYQMGVPWNGTLNKYDRISGEEKSEDLATYKDGKLDGVYIEYYYTDVASKKHYINGILDGEFKYINWTEYYYDKSWGEKTGTYKNGLLHGKHVETFYYGGISKSCNYNMGKLDGIYEEYVKVEINNPIETSVFCPVGEEDGSDKRFLYARMNYSDGSLKGKYELFDPLGKVIYETEFVNGTGVLKTFYGFNGVGKTCSAKEYKNGKLHGSAKTWWENGNLESEAIYNEGKRISYKRWNEDGKVENGQISFEYGDGQTKREEYYENGRLIKEKCWDEEGNVIECE